MTIQVGDTLPATNLTTMTAEGPKPVSMTDLSAGKKTGSIRCPWSIHSNMQRSTLTGFYRKK
jgi:peroxiredoxin